MPFSPTLLCLATCNASRRFLFFFFNDTATTEIYTLSLHDALPICLPLANAGDDQLCLGASLTAQPPQRALRLEVHRSEEHTSELQSRLHLVCRLLLEKKKNKTTVLLLSRMPPCGLPVSVSTSHISH